MALRDQPYFPFYVDDYLTDEKLAECSPETQGVYIRIMCIMHKSEEYGIILLRQKDKQAGQQILNFAEKLHRHIHFSVEIIQDAIIELLNEKVLQLDGDKLLQKRMVRDNKISVLRSVSGAKGGFATAKRPAKETPNEVANTVNAIEDENAIVIKNEKNIIPPKIEWVKKYCEDRKSNVDPETFFNHYEGNGWFRGKTKIKNWQACIITWERGNNGNQNRNNRGNLATIEQRGATAKPGEFDEGVITLEGMRS
jgi:uncharacterized protein YdaU (DUF1376 family)